MNSVFLCTTIVALFGALSTLIDASCHQERPAYCARHIKLCKDEQFKKKTCPRTCGFCKYDDTTNCGDRDPVYCEQHAGDCKRPGLERAMRRLCAKTCGWCDRPITARPTKPTVTYPPPFTGKCGQPEVKGGRVIAGTTPPRGAWPWQILLIYNGKANCGGTLISPQWVVTAAHCIFRRELKPSDFTVRVGEHDRDAVEGSEVEVLVKSITRHPNYSPYTLNNDIAMIKLRHPVKFNKFVHPACLPKDNPPVGTICYITGWVKTKHPGHMTTILQQGLLPVVSNRVCYEKNHHSIPVPITDGMVCGGSGGTSRTSGCHGDSGGPYVCHIDGRWELHGSVSHGSPVCESSDTYTVFARTNYFKQWIAKVVATEP